MTELTPAAESRESRAAAGTGDCHLPLGRRLPRDALSRGRSLAAQRGRLPAQARARVQRLRRLDHCRCARARVAEARLRRERRRPGLPGRSGRAAAQAGGEDDRLSGHRARPDHSRRDDRRAGRRRVPQAPLRPRDTAGSPRQAALRLQRDEHPVGSPLAFREAVHARLPRRRGEGAAGRSWQRQSRRRRPSRRFSRPSS